MSIFNKTSLLIFFLLFHLNLIAQNEVLEKKVTLKYQSVPLKNVLGDLKASHNIDFTYFNQIPVEDKVSIDIEGEPLGTALKELFSKIGLQYIVKGNQLILKKVMQKFHLEGRIIDKETQQPLAYATISIKGKPVGIISNNSGGFGLLIPTRYLNDTLYVSMLGYDDYELDLTQLNRQQPLNIALETESKILEEIEILSDQNAWHIIPPENTKKQKRTNSLVFNKYIARAQLSLDAENIELLKIRCGLGQLAVKPSQTNKIEVDAQILTTSLNENFHQKFLDDFLDLSMKAKGDTAYLNSLFRLESYNKKGKQKFPMGSAMATPGSKIHLTVKVPDHINLQIRDGAGGITIHDLKNNVSVNDGSGNIEIDNVIGDVRIHDRSGEVKINKIDGNVDINDASGGILVKKVKGNLNIKDGSGEIELLEVGQDSIKVFEIYVKDSSGKITARKTGGNLEINDASGEIQVTNLTGNLKIDDHSGKIEIKEIGGEIHLYDKTGKVQSSEKLVRKRKRYYVKKKNGDK